MLDGAKEVAPGKYARIEVELNSEVALKQGERFFNAGEHYTLVGRVTKVLKD